MGDSTNDIPLQIAVPTIASELSELVTIAHRGSDRRWQVAGNSSKLDWGGIVTGAKIDR